jgi:replicative DNA helicase
MTELISRPVSQAPEGPTPPQAVEAERSVLAALMLEYDAISRAAEQLEPPAFYRVSHQKIYEAILAIYNRSGERVDLITLSEELRKRGELEAVGGTPALSQILEYATTTANLDQHIKIIHSKAILRALIRAAGEIQQESYAGSDDTAAILDRAEARVFAITDARVRQGFVALKDLLKPAFEHIQKLFERKVMVTGVDTGYDDLNKLTAGFQNSDLIVIAGRPSSGKTSFALNIAENAAIRAHVPVSVFSLEMNKEQLVQRLLCSQSEVALHRLRNGHLNNEDWPRLTTAAGLLTQAPIMIDDSSSPTVMEIRAKCRRLRAEGKLGMVIIDYLQLIRGSGDFENRVQEISQITRALKALAKELNIPVVALSQLSRAVETRDKSGRPQLSDLRESGCLTADTRIQRADTGAEVTMGELLERGERNIPVWTLDEDLRVVRRTMTHVFASGVKPVFELRLASGRKLEASANHPFYTIDGWKPLESLRAGDRLATPRRVPEPAGRKAWYDEEVVMLAHMLGDGCFASRQPVHYTSSDPANVAAVERAAAHFGITPRRVRQENWWHVYLPAPFALTHGRRNPINTWLEGLGLYGLRSYQKFIPRQVFELPDEQVALFIRHLWATDGCVHLGRGRQARIYYASTSGRLIDDLQALLLRFEIVGRIKTTTKGSYRPSHQLHVYGAPYQLKLLDDIGVHGARGVRGREIADYLRTLVPNTNLDTVPTGVWSGVKARMAEVGMTTRAFAEQMSSAYCGSTLYKHAPSRNRLARVATLLEDRPLQRLAGSDVFWDTIVAIEPRGEKPVFDATVPGTRNFIANGIFAHNSIEQDSDVVMFVYREIMYRKDTPEPGKAHIIIAKQRNGPTADVELTFLRECTKFVPYSPMMAGEAEPSF